MVAAHLKPAMPSPDRSRRPAAAAVSAMSGVAGAMVMVAILILGAALTVIFAATLAFVAVLGGVLLVLAAVAWRVRRRPSLQGGLMVPRPGHAWVAYDWDRRAH